MTDDNVTLGQQVLVVAERVVEEDLLVGRHPVCLVDVEPRGDEDLRQRERDPLPELIAAGQRIAEEIVLQLEQRVVVAHAGRVRVGRAERELPTARNVLVARIARAARRELLVEERLRADGRHMRDQRVVGAEGRLLEQPHGVRFSLCGRQRRAHHHAFQQRTARDLLMHGEIRQEAVIRLADVGARIEAPVDGFGARAADPALRRLDVERDRLVGPVGVLLDERAFRRVCRIEMRVGTLVRRAEEAAHGRRGRIVGGPLPHVPHDARARPPGDRHALVERRGFLGKRGDEVVVERRVVELDRLRGGFDRVGGRRHAQRHGACRGGQERRLAERSFHVPSCGCWQGCAPDARRHDLSLVAYAGRVRETTAGTRMR